MSIYDRLENELKLSHLINSESLANLTAEFAEFHGLSIVSLNPDRVIIHGEASLHRPCGKDSDCQACKKDVPEGKTNDKHQVISCESGLRYLQSRIDNQFDPVGYLLIGPFREADGAEDDVPVMTAKHAEKVAHLMCIVVQEVAFANYQSYLSSKMQLQVTAAQQDSLVGKDDELSGNGEKKSYEDTLLESGELRSLF